MTRFVWFLIMLLGCGDNVVPPALHNVDADPCEVLVPDQPCCEVWLGCVAGSGSAGCQIPSSDEGVAVCRLDDGTTVAVGI